MSNSEAYGILAILGGDDGIADVGATLRAKTGGVRDDDGIDWTGPIAFQWLRDGDVIEGATGATYSVAEIDRGADISLLYRFTDRAGHTEEIEANNPIAIMGVWMITLRVLYTFLLKREPDRAGLIHWARVLRQRAPEGASMAQRGAALLWVITRFISSPGFKREAGE